MKLKVLDTFAGIGGFSLGLERTGGFETVGFVEIDTACQKVLRTHWPEVPVFSDITKTTKETLAHAGIDRIDVVSGGFPCQDLSVAGKGAGLEGNRSGLWFELLRVISEVRPRYALIENVSILRSRGLDVVLRGLAEIGFDAEWHCIPASAVGAPHQRDRVWIMAYPSEVGSPQQCVGDAGGLGEAGEGEVERGDQPAVCAAPRRADVADSLLAGLEGHTGDGKNWAGREEPSGSAGTARLRCAADLARWWSAEPDVGRVAPRLPGDVDRIKQLGNSVVPMIPELLGRAILAHEAAW